MRMINKPISVRCAIDYDGNMVLKEFSIIGDDDMEYTYEVTDTLFLRETKPAGIRKKVFKCYAEVEGYDSTCVMRYLVDSAKWELHTFEKGST